MLHWITASRTAPGTHPQIVNQIIARFLADSAAYLEVNSDARQNVRAGDEPERGERVTQTV